MNARLPFALCLLSATFCSNLAYGEVDLTPRYRGGQLVRVESIYEVAGTLTVAGSDKPTTAPLAVSAASRYDERLLTAESRSSEAGKRVPPRRSSVRYYEPFNAQLVINGEKMRPQLRKARSLVAVSLADETLTMHCPQGPLTRAELDLVQWPCDSLTGDVLLPGEPVAVGDQWDVDASLLAAMLNIGAVGRADVKAELMEANADFARIEAQGVVHGTVDGAATKIEITSRCYFDLRRRMVQSLQMVLNEKRQIGEVTPGVDASSKVKVKFTPITRSENLSDRALAKVDLDARQTGLWLDFTPASGGYKLRHARDWHVTKDSHKAAILRRVEDGDVLGQCNISNLPAIQKGKQVTMKVFQADVQKTLGKNFGQFVNAGEFVDSQGRLVYRVEAVGNVSEVPIRWRYYLVGGTDGHRTALVFTMDEEMTERFAAADRSLLTGLNLVASASATPSEGQAKDDVAGPQDGKQPGSPPAKSGQRVGRLPQ